jgi:hypothetical protein
VIYLLGAFMNQGAITDTKTPMTLMKAALAGGAGFEGKQGDSGLFGP